MAKKAYFEKVAVRPDTKRKIEVLSIYYGPVVAFIGKLIDDLWKQAEAEGKVNDLMLAEPVVEQAPVEQPA